MRLLSLSAISIAVVASCYGQAPKSDLAPVTIEAHSWQPAKQAAPKAQSGSVPPAKAITPEDLIVARKAREFEPRNSMPAPSEITPDGRRAQIDKIEDQAQTPKAGDVNGFAYSATVQNNTKTAVSVIYWEYRFVERTNTSNVVRRQFLCSAKIKPGEKRELTAFSGMGPTDVVSAETLSLEPGKRFDEAVFIDRVEFADDNVIQRRDWKFDDVKKAVERATASRWAPNEVCRPL